MAGSRPKAPAGCYWRGNTIWGRTQVGGREVRWSLQTDNPRLAAQRRRAGKDRAIAEAIGDAKHSFVEVLEAWAVWISKQVSPNTVKRYACSMDQLGPYLDGKSLADVDAKLIGDIIRARSAAGASNATVKRDLVALSSVLNFSIDQGWREDNPALPKMRRLKERRDPIVLPQRGHIEMVIQRCPGMIADMVRVAIATGAREDELLKARRDHIDRGHRQMTIVGKGNKVRVIELGPFGGYELITKLAAFPGAPWLFWHSVGETYKNFASQFSAIVDRTATWAADNGVEFRPFTFHHLRHWHAVHWLKAGRSIYDLQRRLGHTSIKTTEMYCAYLTPDEERTAKGIATGTNTGTSTGNTMTADTAKTLMPSA